MRGISETAMIFLIGTLVMLMITTYTFANRGIDTNSTALDGRWNQNSFIDPQYDTVIYSQSEPQVTEEQVVAYVRDIGGDRLKTRGKVFHEMGVRYDIDPAFGVAVSQKETTLGTNTCQNMSQSCNNFFCMTYNATKSAGIVAEKRWGLDRYWACFENMDAGIEAFYVYIKEKYVLYIHPQINEPQDTISKIGCAPGTGLTEHCYCVGEEEGVPYCHKWLYGQGSVPDIVEKIRNYELEQEPVSISA